MKYFDTMLFPVHLGFTWEENDYLKEMGRLGIKDNNPFKQKISAKTESLEHPEDMDTIIVSLVTKNRKPRIIYPLLAHECIHVWESIKKAMHTTEDHEEIKAYTIQWLLQLMIDELEKENVKKARRK